MAQILITGIDPAEQNITFSVAGRTTDGSIWWCEWVIYDTWGNEMDSGGDGWFGDGDIESFTTNRNKLEPGTDYTLYV